MLRSLVSSRIRRFSRQIIWNSDVSLTRLRPWQGSANSRRPSVFIARVARVDDDRWLTINCERREAILILTRYPQRRCLPIAGKSLINSMPRSRATWFSKTSTRHYVTNIAQKWISSRWPATRSAINYAERINLFLISSLPCNNRFGNQKYEGTCRYARKARRVKS